MTSKEVKRSVALTLSLSVTFETRLNSLCLSFLSANGYNYTYPPLQSILRCIDKYLEALNIITTQKNYCNYSFLQEIAVIAQLHSL